MKTPSLLSSYLSLIRLRFLIFVLCSFISTTSLTAQYCIPTPTSHPVQEITFVEFAGITDSQMSTSESYVYNDQLVAHVIPGETYTLTLKGNTYGSTNHFTAFFDFNNDGSFEESETFNIGTITNSSGHDSKKVTVNIPIPIDAVPGESRIRIKKTLASLSNPCSISGHGQTIDYTMNIGSLESCSDVNAGTITGETTVCAGSDVVLTVDGSADFSLGLQRQWQSSLNGIEWEGIDNASLSTLTKTIYDNTYFRFLISCAGDESDISEPFLVSLKPIEECYCEPISLHSTDYLSQVDILSTVDNFSYSAISAPAGGHDNLIESTSVDVYPGDSVHAITNFIEGGNTVKIWVDWNKDNIYDENELIGTSYSASSSNEVVFDVPPNAEGQYKMRIIGSWGQFDYDACDDIHYGSSLDISINAVNLNDCSNINAGEINIENSTVCPYASFSLLAEGGSNLQNGQTRQWYSSTDSEIWEAIEGATMTSVSFPEGIAQSTYFKYEITCSVDNSSHETNEVFIELNSDLSTCYCIPKPIYYNNAYIHNFSATGNGNTNIENLSSGFSAYGYGDFTEMQVSVFQDGLIDFEADYKQAAKYALTIWVDWNMDGIFDNENELVFQSENYSSSHQGSFAIPNVESDNYRMRISATYIGNPFITESLNPCENSLWGEFEDYILYVEPPVFCNDVTAGVINDTYLNLCPNEAFSLEVEETTPIEVGLTRQWFYSYDQISWMTIEEADKLIHDFPDGINQTTYYKFIVGCTVNETTHESDIITVEIISDIDSCYCIPNATFNTLFIDGFSATGNGESNIINENSGFSANGYGDFTNLVVSADAGGEMDFTITHGGNHTYHSTIWIDWNRNGKFTDEDEVAFHSSTQESTHTSNISIDENASGFYRMRVANNISIFSDGPCEDNYERGEFEDYTLYVNPLNNCAQANAGIPIFTNLVVCAGEAFELEVEGFSLSANGLSQQWYKSVDGENWESIDDANYNVYTAYDGIDATTWFKYVMNCSHDSSTSETEIINVELNQNLTDCYCAPEGTNSGYYIDAFYASGGGNQNIGNSNSGFSENGYGDFSDMVVEVKSSTWIYFSTLYNEISDLRIWVDWNQDGEFGNDEVVFDGPSAYSHDSQFYIPENVNGMYKMRIANNANGEEINPCESMAWGEYEDYSIQVLPWENCAAVSSGEVVDDFNVCQDQTFQISTQSASLPDLGLTGQWFSSPAGENQWSEIVGANYAIYTVQEGINQPTDYYFAVHCDYDNSESETSILSIGLNNYEDCFCQPSAESVDTEPFNISMSTYYDTLLYDAELPAAYENLTETFILDAAPGELLTVTFGANYYRVRVWVDWDRNGIFDSGELMDASNFSASELNFNIPDNASGTYRMRVLRQYVIDVLNPCVHSLYVAAVDVTLNVVDAEDCLEVNAGEIIAETEVCVQKSFILKNVGASSPTNNLSRQWSRSSDNINWEVIENASDYVCEIVDGIVEPTYFKYTVFCLNSGLSSESQSLLINLKQDVHECYCVPKGFSNSRYINSFETSGGIQNISNLNSGSSPNGYGDFTEMAVEQTSWSEISFEVEIQTPSRFQIWVDWNQDGVFSDEEVVFFSGNSAYLSHSGTFIVPETALTGATRMRIGSKVGVGSTAELNPCEGSSLGEYEDYTFIVGTLPECMSISLGEVSDDLTLCPLEPFTLDVLDASEPAEGLNKQWYTSSNGNNWEPIPNSYYPTYIFPEGISETKKFKYVITCQNNNSTVESDVITIDIIANPNDCYCSPSATYSEYFINNFIAIAGENILQNLNSGFSPNGYGDFTDLSIAQGRGEIVNFKIEIASDYADSQIWIDWNQDGTFSDNELVAAFFYPDQFFIGSFTVPQEAKLGPTRMRVSGHKKTDYVDACELDFSFGEFEDYTFIVEGEDFFECEILEANIGDQCWIDNEQGVIDNDCQCHISISVDCVELDANVGDDCWQNNSTGTVDENCDCIINTGPIGFQSIEAEYTVISVDPNPSSGDVFLNVKIEQPTHVLIEIYDMNGRKVSTIHNQQINGKTDLNFFFNGNFLPNGIYICRLTTSKESIIEKFMIAR